MCSNRTLQAILVTWTYLTQLGSGTDIFGDSGMVYWQGYNFVIVAGKIWYSLEGTGSYTDWTSTVDPTGQLLAGSTHYAISSKTANVFYFCNGSQVVECLLNPGETFDPGNAATYRFTFNNLLPTYDMSTCMAEINGQLLIGGALNRVYPWDAQNVNGNAVASHNIGQPLFTGDRYIQRIVVVNSNAYIFTGHPVLATGRGYIYISNGATMDVFQKMPDNFVTINGPYSDTQIPYWRFGDAMWHRNQLMFGALAISNTDGSVIADTGGVWGLDINSSALYRANLMSNGNVSLPLVLNPNDTGTSIEGMGYVAGGLNTVAGTKVMNNTTTLLSTPARTISDMIPAGTFLNKGTFEQVELKLAVALAVNETIAVTVITDLNPNGFLIGTMTSADGMSKAFTPVANIQNLQWVQIQCLLTPTNTNGTFVRLREIRIR